MDIDRLAREAALRIGEVSAVTGRRVFISVDTDKNLSELFFGGHVLRNIAVGSYVDIRKGFLSLIGKVEGENAQADDRRISQLAHTASQRVLSVSLVGFVDRRGEFFGGTKELPLVGNEAFLLTKEKVHQIHNLVSATGVALDIAWSEYEGYDIALPVDGLINSHIAIFGNTGSGKSNTLAMTICGKSYLKAMQMEKLWNLRRISSGITRPPSLSGRVNISNRAQITSPIPSSLIMWTISHS